ncbi:MAG: tetratricopeptide repeat protein [Myxococcota bacterium]
MGAIQRGFRLLLCLAILSGVHACAGGRGGRFAPRLGALRISEALNDGDAARRASVRLVLDGLDSDVAGSAGRARGSYERAMQVDPTNPYAYLAIARHYVEGAQPERALPFLDQAAALFAAQGENSPRVGVHLSGLRGEAHYSSGRIGEGVELLERARDLAPYVWSDGHLSADELR